MRQHILASNTIWCVHSARSGEYWLVRCPSRSGAKIYLCGPHGPRVPASKGPFESWEYPEADIPAGVEVLQATFFAANDPRNWKPEVEAEETEDAAELSGAEGVEPPAAESG